MFCIILTASCSDNITEDNVLTTRKHLLLKKRVPMSVLIWSRQIIILCS